MKKFNRRDFLSTAGTAGLGLSLFGPSLIADPIADMAVVKGEDPAKATNAAIEAIGGMKRFVKPGQSVMIKPNMSWDRVPNQAATTNPHVVGAVVALCKKAGAKRVVVTDNTLNDARRCFTRSGIAKTVKQAGGQAVFMNQRKFKVVDTGGKALGKWPVYQDALDFDVLISVPVIKHHSASRLSMGMKNLYGLIGGARSRLHQNMDQGIADLAKYFKPHLTIIDGYRILTRNGPSGGRISDTRLMKTIVATHDLVAADTKGAEIFGINPSEVGYIKMAADMGLGTNELNKLNVKNINL